MLSYAEHGKFPATTQGQSPRARDEKVVTVPIRRGFLPWSASVSVDHGNRTGAMVDRAAAASGDIEGDRLGDGLAGILRLQVIFAVRYARTRNLGRTAAAFAQRVALRGGVFSRDLVDEHDRGARRHIRVGHADAVRGLADVVEGWHRDILVSISGGCECVMST